jgi:L-ascorbate metabolism protein UlaG (beta-lactamase superfamily)
MLLGDHSLTWLGHATVRLDLADGTVAFIDPWLDGPTCPDDARDPERVDSIYITHGHFDHIGNTEDLVAKHQPSLFAIHEICVYLGDRGAENPVGSNKGGTVEGPGGIKGTLVEASHSSGISGDDGIVAGGEACGWMLELPGGTTLYHAGDTGLFGDMALIGDMFDIDVALLPIGGHYTMGPDHAAKAARMLQAKAVLPIHYGTFPILAGTPAELKDALEGSGIVVVDAEIGTEL